MKYYSIHRPIAPGTFPSPEGNNRIVNLRNFDDRIYCEEIGWEAWGWIEYAEPISERDAAAYELVNGWKGVD